MSSILRLRWLAVLLLAAPFARVAATPSPIAALAPPALEAGEGRPLPAWLRSEMEIRASGSGRWLADNRTFQSADEPFDQYGVEWRWGIGRQSLTGRLFGLRDGAEVATFWEFRLAWDPYRGSAHLQQWGLGGTFGEGELRSTGEGVTDLVQIFRRPGGPAWATRHVTSLTATEERGESFDLVEGTWRPGRTYVWRPAP